MMSNVLSYFDSLSIEKSEYKIMQLASKNNYVLDGLALRCETTLLYGPPGIGKTILTLHMIIDACRKSLIQPKQVYYFNADDSINGLREKLKIIKPLGINMFSPALHNLSPSIVLNKLRQMLDEDKLDGLIFIFDTLKKFNDMMNKLETKHFFLLMDSLRAAGATCIILGHSNKKRSPDGSIMFEGTSDVMSDPDCLYCMDFCEADIDMTSILFTNEKMRGSVLTEAMFCYERTTNSTYKDILDSIRMISQDELELMKTNMLRNKMLEKYDQEVKFLRKVLTKYGRLNQSEIVGYLPKYKNTFKASRRKTLKALNQFVGDLWSMSIGSHNTRWYEIPKASEGGCQ